LLHKRKRVLIIMGFYVRFGIGPLRYSTPITRRVRRTPKQQEAHNRGCAIVFLLFAAYCIVALIVKAAITHPAAALLIGCIVAGAALLGLIGVQERRIRFERNALPGVQRESADSRAIVNDASSERIVNQNAVGGELATVNLSAEPGLDALIESVDVEEPGDHHAQPACSEVTPPDASMQLLPAKRAESDPVAVAAARVAEKWRELEQLDSKELRLGPIWRAKCNECSRTR
jgi:hypothetical protein